jgi:transcriptional regulator with XRE-family HTH domain
MDFKRARGRTEDGKPNPIDVHVGARLRACRQARGLSQEVLSSRLGITFQQVQKYERGDNRMGSSRLYDLSVILGVSVGYFFEEISDQTALMSPRAQVKSSPCDTLAAQPDGHFTSRETLDLVRVYYQITDLRKRRRIYDLARILASSEQVES